VTKRSQRDDGTQNGPGEQIRARDGHEDSDLDNLRGGADPSGGRSSEVPRDNGKSGAVAHRDISDAGSSRSLSDPGGLSSNERRDEEILARKGPGEPAPSAGGDK